MELILAIDLMGGAVVHGQSGNRSRYAPLNWGLSQTAEPLAYVEAMKPKYVYIADLDRIEGKGSHDETVKLIASRVARCYIDRGCRSPSDYLVFQNITNVVGTETAHYSLSQYTGGYLSLDIKNGKTIPSGDNPVHILEKAVGLGFEGCIILNLSAVGTSEGISVDYLGRMREVYGKPLLYGGGIAGTPDLDRLRAAGYDGAIVATGVHRGTIPIDAVRRGTWS